MISKRLIEAVKLAPMRSYRIAQQANLHPSTLSKIINGIESVKPGDDRVVRVAEVLGIPLSDCFAKEDMEKR